MYLVTIGADTPMRRAASAKLPNSTTLANATMQVNLSIFLSPQERFHCPTGIAPDRGEIRFAPAPISKFHFSRRAHGCANSMLTPTR
jgi:hypothetical protein